MEWKILDQSNIVKEEYIAWSPSGRLLFVRALTRWNDISPKRDKVKREDEGRLFEGIDRDTPLEEAAKILP